MIVGEYWWRANEIDIRHLNRQREPRYRSRDKARASPRAASQPLNQNALTADVLALTGEMSRASVGREPTIGELGLRECGRGRRLSVLADRILAACDPAAPDR
jgi:hypothetical protein